MSTIHPQFRKAAKAAADAAIEEVKLFCKIMCYPENDILLVGEDPHGIVSIGDDFYNMTDIHVVISQYDHWISIYGSDSILRKVIWQWYDWRTEWYNKHPRMEWVNTKCANVLTGEICYNLPPVQKGEVCSMAVAFKTIANGIFEGIYDYAYNEFVSPHFSAGRNRFIKEEVECWLRIREPDNTHDINLKSWLMGCPVEGLREATPEYEKSEGLRRKEASEMLEQVKGNLGKLIDEENGGF